MNCECQKKITISLCMIVKNEEKVLARCLDSLAGLMDEIIIVDTGSGDKTKEIAARYTNKIYDFVWVDDFSEARNFAFSKATGDYIYSADADEVMDEENRKKFQSLKECLDPDIEIVQMKYGNQLQYNTVYNFDEEYRPKLFKRLRPFIWQDPIHETVRLEPVIYDSEIVITHMPENLHAGRDFSNLQKQLARGRKLSAHLREMYVRELFIAGKDQDFLDAEEYFKGVMQEENCPDLEMKEACCVVARAARIRKDAVSFMKYALKVVALEGCSEICCELGLFYSSMGDYEEGAVWYYNAIYETEPAISLQSANRDAFQGLIGCYENLGLTEQADNYRREAKERHLSLDE